MISSVYRVYQKIRNPNLMLYNSDKRNSYLFMSGSLFALIFCLFNEGSPFFKCLKICIYNYVVKRNGRNYKKACILLVIFHAPHAV